MFRRILLWGTVAGLIVGSILFGTTVAMADQPPSMAIGMALGYTSMLIALSAIFAGVKRHRDETLHRHDWLRKRRWHPQTGGDPRERAEMPPTNFRLARRVVMTCCAGAADTMPQQQCRFGSADIRRGQRFGEHLRQATQRDG